MFRLDPDHKDQLIEVIDHLLADKTTVSWLIDRKTDLIVYISSSWWSVAPFMRSRKFVQSESTWFTNIIENFASCWLTWTNGVKLL